MVMEGDAERHCRGGEGLLPPSCAVVAASAPYSHVKLPLTKMWTYLTKVWSHLFKGVDPLHKGVDPWCCPIHISPQGAPKRMRSMMSPRRKQVWTGVAPFTPPPRCDAVNRCRALPRGCEV